jgi:carboxylesterase type B
MRLSKNSSFLSKMKLISTVVGAISGILSILSPSATAQSSPTVTIINGTLQGVTSSVWGTDHFLGIPFAQPPTGSLRFNLPRPINETWQSVLNATAFGPFCINYQLGLPVDPADISYAQSEDCLTINVIRPTGTTTASALPVLVWIYGGGYQEGGGSDGRYNSSYIVKNSVDMGLPTISVTFNYRLNGWGFLAGDSVRSAGKLNAGLYDQRLALQWIQENIAAFGGDPTKVTIQGESAGAASVGFHILAYNGRDDGLFRAAICESGGPFYYGTFNDDSTSESQYSAVLSATNCTNAASTLACVQSAAFEDLNGVFATQYWFPVVDGVFIANYTSTLLAKGHFVRVPLLIGSNTDEGKLFAGAGANSDADFTTEIEQGAFGRPSSTSVVELLAEAYPYPGNSTTHGQSDDTISPAAGYGSQFFRSARYFGDSLFIAGRRYSNQVWAEAGLTTYSYRFNTIPAGWDADMVGATHFMEVGFVFDNVLGTGMDESSFAVEPATRAKSYQALGQLMSRMWLSFANTLNPNNHGSKLKYP